MSPTTKRILLSCLVIGAAICLCVSVISIAASAILLLNPASPVAVNTPESAVITRLPASTPIPKEATSTAAGTQAPAQATATPHANTPGASPTATPPGPSLPSDVSQQMDEIQEQVVELRMLKPKNPVERRLLTPEELSKRVQDDFFKDYTTEKAHNDALSQSTFGLLELDFDLISFFKAMYTEQIAGFYDNEDKTMFVIAGEGFHGIERLTYSHEYTHALQDQNYDIQNGLKHNQEDCKKDSERCAAVLALMEGDASTLEVQWFSTFATPQDARQIQDFYANYKSPIFDSAPDFIKEDFLFPYQAGQKFVQSLIDKGGWEAVNAAYTNPPVSTEQILHPERYPDDKPVTVSLPDLAPVLGESWKKLEQEVMGEWSIYLILAHGLKPDFRLSDNTARQAAEGWGGNAYAIYYNESTKAVVMVFDTRWDTVNDARQFASAFRRYATARFGDPSASQDSFNAWQSPLGYQTFHLDTDRTVWIQAVDAAQADAVWKAIAGE